MNRRNTAAIGERKYKSRGQSCFCHQNSSETVGLVPFNTAPVVSAFLKLKRSSKEMMEVTGEKVNRGGGYGLEVSSSCY